MIKDNSLYIVEHVNGNKMELCGSMLKSVLRDGGSYVKSYTEVK